MGRAWSVNLHADLFSALSRMGTSTPIFCDSSASLRIWVDRSSDEAIAPMTAPTNSFVTDTEVVLEGKMYESEVVADLGDFDSGGPVPQHFRPAFDAIHQMAQGPGSR